MKTSVSLATEASPPPHSVKKTGEGTDKEFFASLRLRTPTKGRPKVNREIAIQAIRAGYSTNVIARRILKCSPSTVRRIKQEMIEAGEIAVSETLDLEKVALEFDDECQRAVGISFFDWMRSKSELGHRRIFGFCKRVWTTVWDKPSLILVKDPTNPLGDKLCMRFLEVFGEDKKRIRRRKKEIRYLFRFLGRFDLCDRYLTMSKSRDPEEIREIPELTLTDFPTRLNKALNMVREVMGDEVYEALRFKIVTQMRTGRNERELVGITVGRPNGSWILFRDKDTFRGQIIAKGGEKWVLEWLPRDVRHGIYRIYQRRNEGDHLFGWGRRMIDAVRDEFKRACEKVGLPPLRLHDLRKVAITWLWACGIDLAIATEINVGWKDLNTAKKHYLHMAELLKNSRRREYCQNIPAWFKDGLDEYLTFNMRYT